MKLRNWWNDQPWSRWRASVPRAVTRSRMPLRSSRAIPRPVPLALATIFLPRVVPPRAAGPSRLDGLAVDAAGAGFRSFTGRFPHPNTERVLDRLPEPATAPLMEIVVDRPFRGEVVRQGGPCTARAQDVGDGIEELTEVGLPRSTHRQRRR